MLDKYLGCEHKLSEVPRASLSDAARELFQWPPTPVESQKPVTVKPKGPPLVKGGVSDAFSKALKASETPSRDKSYDGLGVVRLIEYDMSGFFPVLC
jgi:hypothetical protein